MPLLYAVWGDAPSEIIQLLVNIYQSLYPDRKFKWSKMVETLGANVQLTVIQNLLDVQQEFFCEQYLNWDQVLDSLLHQQL